MLMLTLDDAAKVARRLVDNRMDDDEIIRQELEQKCWIAPKADEAAKNLNDLIYDIYPAEICRQIEADNLREWCATIRINMLLAMARLRIWEGTSDEHRNGESDF